MNGKSGQRARRENQIVLAVIAVLMLYVLIAGQAAPRLAAFAQRIAAVMAVLHVLLHSKSVSEWRARSGNIVRIDVPAAGERPGVISHLHLTIAWACLFAVARYLV